MRTSGIWIGAASVALLDVAVSIEAFRSGHAALGAVASVAAVGAIAIALAARRPAFELRSDLAAWTSRIAAATHEPETEIVNRAVARHRAALDAERGSGA